MKSSELTLAYIDIDLLKLHPENEKGHDIATIKASMLRFGFTSPVELDERTKMIAAGHGRVLALKELRDVDDASPPSGIATLAGSWAVPVVKGWRSKNDREARAHRISDNQTTMLGGWELPKLTYSLTDLIESGAGLDGVGFTNVDLAKFLTHLDDATLDPASKIGALTYYVMIECNGEEQQRQLLERFEAEGLTVRLVST